MRPTRALINLGRLRQNIRNLKSLISGETSLMAVVKANAYGHGLLQIAKCSAESGAAWLGVALPEEGAELRENGISLPILVLGDVSEEQCETVIKYNLTQAVPSLKTARYLNSIAQHTGRKVGIHLKLDTGMGRIGFHNVDELRTAIKELHSMKGIFIDGAFTHFAAADEIDPDYTIIQIKRLENMQQIIQDAGFTLNWIHASNSAGLLMFPKAHYNLVRCGISLYGYYPSAHVEKHAKISLVPILQWETRIVYIKTLEAGSSVSYGRSFIASSTRKVATLPVGYADGYSRLLGNRASVLIRGKRAPVIGRVCMDQIMVDITHIPEAAVGDKAVLLGEQGAEKITADELADLCGTISYEILTSISQRVPRIYQEA
ncbi:MAG: alanine racemase [Caldicoprobacterales bacterium]|jgi:alanine racemase